VNLSLLFRQLKNLDEILVACGVEVEALAVSSRYEEPVKALTCFFTCKGAFREYASGGKSNRLGITRQGNRYLRTALIEANQRGYRSAAGWTVRGSVDLNASDDLEGKTEIGKSARFPLAERAAIQHAVPVNRSW